MNLILNFLLVECSDNIFFNSTPFKHGIMKDESMLMPIKIPIH